MNEDQWKADLVTENEQSKNQADGHSDVDTMAVTDTEIVEHAENSEEAEVSLPEAVHSALEEVPDLYTSPNIYESQNNPDIYTTPSTERIGTGGVFSGQSVHREETGQSGTDQAQGSYQSRTYGSQGGNAYQPQSYYGTQDNRYRNQSSNVWENTYGNQSYGPQGNTYGNQFYGAQGNAYGNQVYGSQGNTYGNQFYGAQGNAYGNQAYGPQGNAYQNQAYGPQGNTYGNQPYGVPGGYDNPYSPYAVPGQHKKHTGLIIGVVTIMIILFLVAIFAVIYYALQQAAESRNRSYGYNYDRNYEFFDDYDDDYDYRDYDRSPDRDHDNYFDNRDNDDDEEEDRNKYEEEYYELEDDIHYDLSYSVSWEYFEYEPEDDADVLINVEYPVIEGDSVPNLDYINDLISDEVDYITEYYEDGYADYMTEDSYFWADAEGYVTYMDEDVLSIVFSERIDCDFYPYVYLYCINIDMRNGVVMENTEMLDIDDDFSVDFRKRSDTQNGTVSGLDYMSDQTITDYLTDSSSLIVFYTPLGMEIGLNYDEGWVTVTYKDYEQYLKIF